MVFAETIFTHSLLRVLFLELLVRNVLAPTLTVSWTGHLLGVAVAAVAAAGWLSCW